MKLKDSRKKSLASAILFVALLAFAHPVEARESSAWDRVHKVFSKSYGAKKHGRFSMFIGSIALKFAKPDGVKGVKISFYHDADTSRDPQGKELEGAVGPDWSQIIRAIERDGSRTHVFTRWKGETRVEVMLVRVEADESTVIRAEIEPEKLAEFVSEIR